MRRRIEDDATNNFSDLAHFLTEELINAMDAKAVIFMPVKINYAKNFFVLQETTIVTKKKGATFIPSSGQLAFKIWRSKDKMNEVIVSSFDK